MIDYMIMEAVMIKTQQEDAEAQKKAEEEHARAQWRKNPQTLKEELAQTGQQ